MPPRLFSHFVQHDDNQYDPLLDGMESRAGLDVDEENLTHHFRDDDFEQADGLALDDSSTSTPRSPVATTSQDPHGTARMGRQEPRPRWLMQEDDGDNDVPASLLVEGPETTPTKTEPPRSNPQQARNAGRNAPNKRRIQAQWETAQAQQRLHQDDEYGPSTGLPQPGGLPRGAGFGGTPKDKALFRWANVTNLDVFIRDVYDYYLGAGIWCILLERFLHLMKVLFLASLLTLLSQCIDYTKLRDSKSLSQILIPQCTKHMWGVWNVSLWVCSFYFIWKSIQWILDVPRLLHIRDFFVHLLEIPEEDMQTVSWQDVVSKITALRDENVKTATNITPSQQKFLTKQLGQHVASQSKERLDAHDIANRLMRRENYIIALFNKDVLDLTAPIPFLRNRHFFSKSLEWTVQFGVLDLVFNEGGQVHQRVLKSDHRGHLSREMQTRFFFAAVMNLIFAPFVASALLIDFVFTYYNEFKTNTSSLGARHYTPLARWKFREFNELPHLFDERLNMSYPFAKHYIDQFPKKKTESMARTVQFFTGALIAVMAIVGFSDPEMFVDFEVFPGMNGFAFIALLTTTWAVAHGMVSEENDVFDPEFAMKNVIEYTHYEPDQWKNRLHSYEVKAEFSELYKSRIIIFLEEIIGVLATPIVLMFSLPKCSDQIIDFFREFTIHVDGLGYVCSFAVFDFQKDQRTSKQPQQGNQNDAREDYYTTKHGKMQASLYGFLDNYVYHPRTGLPGTQVQGPAGRHQFHPPPSFPGLMSPTLAADMRSSRIGRSERPRSRAPTVPRTPRFGPTMLSPRNSMLLLDQHHQPHHSTTLQTAANRTPQRATRRGGLHYQGDNRGDTIEESLEDTGAGPSRSVVGRQDTNYTDNGDIEESVARLGESTWEGSPTRRAELSRDNSALTNEGGENGGPGVVTMLKQFQQAHMDRRGVM